MREKRYSHLLGILFFLTFNFIIIIIFLNRFAVV